MKILIVEDEAYLQQLYKEILELKGHEVVGQAHNGQEAVDLYLAMESKPDWLIMDHRMPVMDGLAATRLILAEDQTARVIFASADTSIIREAHEAGAVGFLSKPFSVKELCQAIEEPLKIMHIYLATNEGLTISSIQREEKALDADLFTSMLTAIDDFASHSLRSLVPSPHYIKRMDYGPFSIGVHLAPHYRLILVYRGFANNFLDLRMEDSLHAIEKKFGFLLKNWDGDRGILKGIEKLLEPIIGERES